MATPIRKPTVDTYPVAQRHAAPPERIIEFGSGLPNGPGGLISFVRGEDGTLLVLVYRMDEGVTVQVGSATSLPGGVAAGLAREYMPPAPPASAFVLVSGNPVDGFTFYGPVPTTENPELERRAEREFPDSGATWWYAPLIPAAE